MTVAFRPDGDVSIKAQSLFTAVGLFFVKFFSNTNLDAIK